MYVRHPLWLDATFEPKLRIEPMEPHSDRLSAHPEVSLREDHPILQATFRHEGLQLPQRCLLRSRKSAVPRQPERANQLWCGFSRFKWRISASWNWEKPDWPNFSYNSKALEPADTIFGRQQCAKTGRPSRRLPKLKFVRDLKTAKTLGLKVPGVCRVIFRQHRPIADMPGHAYNSILDLVRGCPDLIAGRFGDMTAGLGSTAIQPPPTCLLYRPSTRCGVVGTARQARAHLACLNAGQRRSGNPDRALVMQLGGHPARAEVLHPGQPETLGSWRRPRHGHPGQTSCGYKGHFWARKSLTDH